MREFHTDAHRVDEVLEPVEFAIAQDAESFHQVQHLCLEARPDILDRACSLR